MGRPGRPGRALVAVLAVAGAVGLAVGAFVVLRSAPAARTGTCAVAAPASGATSVAAAASASGATPAAAPAIDIVAPVAVSAGTPIDVRIDAPGIADGQPIRLVILRGDAPAIRDLVVDGGAAAVTLDPALSAAAGPITLDAWTCQGRAATARLHVRPGPPAGTLTPLTGPKRIAAGTAQTATAVVLAFDAWGNPVADGTPVDWQARTPDGRVAASVVPTRGLLSALRLPAGTIAGETTVAATIGDVRGGSAVIAVTPGAPADDFAIAIEGPDRAAVGSRDRRVVLRGLTDRSGNRLEDGELVTILVTEPDGRVRTEQAPLIAGGIDTVLEPPAVPGTVEVRLRVRGATSAAATAVYEPAAVGEPVPLRAVYDPAIRSIRVAIGPVVGDLGAFAPDGSEVVLTASGAHGWVDQRSLRLTDGSAALTIPVVPGETSVHLYVRSAFGRTETTVIIEGGAAGPSASPEPSARPDPTATPALDLPRSGS